MMAQSTTKRSHAPPRASQPPSRPCQRARGDGGLHEPSAARPRQRPNQLTTRMHLLGTHQRRKTAQHHGGKTRRERLAPPHPGMRPRFHAGPPHHTTLRHQWAHAHHGKDQSRTEGDHRRIGMRPPPGPRGRGGGRRLGALA